MLKRIVPCISSLVPSVKENEGFALETKCIPEKIFYNVVDTIRSIFDSKIDREKDLFFDQFFVDTIIFFSFFFLLCYVIYVLPMIYLSNDPTKNLILGQVFVITLLDSIVWAGYVYIIQSFKNLTREKFLPAVDKIPQTLFNYPKFFRQFFEGLRIEWNTGFGFNIYLRSTLVGILLLITIFIFMKNPMSELIPAVFISHSLDAIIPLYLSIIVICVVTIPVFIVFLTIFTIPIIFFYLLVAARFLPLEINAFHDMGGTEQFGKIIINCIYLGSFALGMIPFFPLIGKLDLGSFHIPIPEGSLGNVTTLIKGEMVSSVNAIPINSLSNYNSNNNQNACMY